jgi:hypothetical protein
MVAGRKAAADFRPKSSAHHPALRQAKVIRFEFLKTVHFSVQKARRRRRNAKMNLDKFGIFLYIIIFNLLLVNSICGQESEAALSGGQFSVTKTVIAGGGGVLQQSQTNTGNTIGQAVAGKRSSGGNFTLYSGFWTPDALAPTASSVIVGGQIKTADGLGIRSVRVTILFPNGQTQTALSGSFGYYHFTEIPVGAVYVISVSAKKYVFSQPTRIYTIMDEIQNIDFIADSL